MTKNVLHIAASGVDDGAGGLTQAEIRIVRAIRSRQGWTASELADELSRGRKTPMSTGTLASHIHKLRKKGFPILARCLYYIEAPRAAQERAA